VTKGLCNYTHFNHKPNSLLIFIPQLKTETQIAWVCRELIHHVVEYAESSFPRRKTEVVLLDKLGRHPPYSVHGKLAPKTAMVPRTKWVEGSNVADQFGARCPPFWNETIPLFKTVLPP